MNILFLDKEPKTAANFVPDNYAGKMALEAAQVLCDAIRVKLGKKGNLKQVLSTPLGRTEMVAPYPYVLEEDEEENPFLYLVANMNHPVTLWARYSKTNFNWIVKYAKELVKIDKEVRSKKKGEEVKEHSCIEMIKKCEALSSQVDFSWKGLTPPAICHDGKAITSDDAVTSYRFYLHFKKCEWSDGRMPEWFDSQLNIKLSEMNKKNKKQEKEQEEG